MKIRILTITSLLLTLGSAAGAKAQGLSLTWWTIDGGGGRSMSGDGTLEISGTIGQPDAGVQAGGSYELTGGFQQPQPAENCIAPGIEAGVAGVSVSQGVHDGYIDPRRESSNGVDYNQGLSTLTLRFTTPMENADGSDLTADRFTISDTAGDPPSIVGIATADGQSVSIAFDGIISVGEWTTISVANVRARCGNVLFEGSIDIGFLPADVNQSGNVNPLDLLRFKQYVNDLATPAVGVMADYIDINRSGSVSPLDLLAFKQLINHLGPATQSWQGQSLPPRP